MEADELKSAWQSLDRRLSQQNDIQLALLRDHKLERARGGLRPLIVGQVLQMLLGVAGRWRRCHSQAQVPNQPAAPTARLIQIHSGVCSCAVLGFKPATAMTTSTHRIHQGAPHRLALST